MRWPPTGKCSKFRRQTQIAPSLPIFFTFLITLIGLWCWFLYREKQVWRQRGIPGPPTNIFFGHTVAIYKSGGVIAFDQENFQKYGKTYGSFINGRPFLSTMDMDLLRRVYIKDFSHFTNRFANVDQGTKEMVERSLVRNTIFFTRDDDWRRVRNTVTPAFTTGKLKKLLPTICESTRRMSDYLEKEFIAGGKEIPLKDVFGRFVMDVIGRAGFSLDFGTFSEDEGGENMLLQHARKALNPGRKLYFLIVMSFCPMVRQVLERVFNYDLIQNEGHQFFEHFLSDLYDQRKADPRAKEKYTDIFQLLMNAVEENEAADSMIDNSMIGNGKAATAEDAEFIHREIWAKPAQQSRRLSKLELLAQSFQLLVAGFDTTSSVLHFAIYLLATHPEVQEKLRQEILDVLGDEEEVGYEHLRRMQFLLAVLQETLRMFPPLPTINRECGQDLELNGGIQLRAGDIIALPIYAMQHSEDFYPEPEKFQPERFLPEEKAGRDQLSFLAFGLGPRNCIGMRLAEYKMQVALALIIRRFRFRPGPKTEKFPPKINSVFFLLPVDPLFVLAEKI